MPNKSYQAGGSAVIAPSPVQGEHADNSQNSHDSQAATAERAKTPQSLVEQLTRLAAISKAGEFCHDTEIESLPAEEQGIARLLCEILENYQAASRRNLLKYKLTSEALGLIYWEMTVLDGELFNPQNPFTLSPELLHMLGYDNVEEFSGVLAQWLDLMHPDERAIPVQGFPVHLESTEGATPFSAEHRLRKKDGSYASVRVFGTTLRDEQGLPSCVVGALEDITEQTNMLANIKTRDDELTAQAHWYKSILDNIPTPLKVTDSEMQLAFVNRAAEHLFGLNRDALIGKHCSSLGFAICGTENCATTCLKRGIKQTFFKHNDLSYQVDAAIIRDLSGEISGFLEVINDVTEAENMARSQADMANEAKTTFLATMSHEIRTPLNAIIGMTAIGNRSVDVAQKNYALQKIEESSTYLLGIINNILDMSKIEADKLELSPVEFSIEHMLQKVMTVVNYRADEKQLEFSVNLADDVPRFFIGDDQRLAQIIANLLSNAVKFTPEGGKICLDISLLGSVNGLTELRFEVADNGIGISAEQKEKLFSAFTQAESGTSREFGGSGLGLAISKRLAEMMGGSIRVESELGLGSRFVLTVKMPEEIKNPRSLLQASVPCKSLRVLIADSSAFTRQHLKDSFDRLDIAYETAADGLVAYQLIEQQGMFDLAFIDVQLSGMDGVALAKWIKSCNSDAKVILTSTLDWETLQGAVQSSGANKGLKKPIFSSALVDCLNECLGNRLEGQGSGHSNEFKGRSLLLAEDVEINREIVLTLLEGTGLAIDCAQNGKEALDMVAAHPNKYDIVFMDMQMPVMDGLEATAHIRALPKARCREIPIIAMTANVFKSDIENCLNAGMNGHIGKPINLDDVLETLRTYLLPKKQGRPTAALLSA